ncbi:hypothetical protein RM780_20455 [Streptomyces sp. DSM 44917]|uniref:Uncharacterized protein n=1 Tax=Streptomyces boetiae TaxID=3075541 RepID=A0ABU2LCL8_9ACTN|nr:hypothetical protein [Streptomyces sp. DSM 44917]MDT0309314.1 hypothetical protein [Streptomyces sp. DSM 44917]
MTERELYADRSWSGRAAVRLTDRALTAGGRTMPLAELNLVATAEAYLRGRWLGGGGAERPLAALGRGRDGRGVVPVIRISGSVRPVKTRRADEFARAYGDLAVHVSGGPQAVAEAARQAEAEGVPLWMARRAAPGPVLVAVDRRLVRADVWATGPDGRVTAARLRGPYGLTVRALRASNEPPLTVTVGERPARLVVQRGWRRSQRAVVVESLLGTWVLRRQDGRSSRLLREERPVALITRPDPRTPRNATLLPLAGVRHESPEALDAVMAHFFGTVCGLGDETGTLRFGVVRPLPEPDEEVTWEMPWFTGLGSDSSDSGPGGGGDGWGSGDGGGGDGGSGGGGGSGDGGGGGGDGGGGGGGGD